ncbi:allene oxide synthase-lipoxygenase protein-like isoform X1 [Haliotis rubra]|uniref:allene oxide synthase-lipoxygenase protein-like isoform X1 n=1 Tax=Haliotis rubra TaxID=36100 RepID=UPI001EE58926|nr:allene oxide synthase-lipoxygenase protein-like isoform X1 [Haliotis rubra]
MGGCFSGPHSEYVVYVRTGDKKNAGTDANVTIILHDDNGHCTGEVKLDNFLRDDFEKGRLDTFPIPKSKLDRLGKVIKVEFWRDNAGIASAWYVERIMVENKVTNDMFVFPVFRWIKADYHYVIKHLDTSLPQFDDQAGQRKMELESKKKDYNYVQRAPGMPAQILVMPPDEQFSFEYKWDILTTKVQLIATSKIVSFSAGEWDSLTALTNVYTKKIFHTPAGADRWSNDIYFGHQRIASLNHSLIKLCKSIPDKLAVDEDMLKPLLEGETIESAIRKKRLFICDYEILKDLPHRPNFVMCAPIGLFFVNSNKRLVPIAIQLFQERAPDNPVFVPTDPPNTWAMVKMWYNNCDAMYHQSLTHLGYTHLLMEGVTVATHRNLSQSHPLFKLLAPHFLYLIAINTRGLEMLVCEGGWVDKTMNGGMAGMFELIKRGLEQWRLDVHGTLPEDLRRRGLDDLSVLPGYHFRDDALLLYKAINAYASKYVKLYYDSPEKITDDWELQNWGHELTKAREEGGVGLLGVPANGKFTTTDQLIMVLTTIIYTCSVSHASTNFPQYEEYAFPPNYPGLMRGVPPVDKSPMEESDIISALPDKPTTLDIMTVTKILSQRGTKNLGDFEVQYIFDPKARDIVDAFRQDLKEVSKTVKDRNETRNPPYIYLDPDIVPNSISI